MAKVSLNLGLEAIGLAGCDGNGGIPIWEAVVSGIVAVSMGIEDNELLKPVELLVSIVDMRVGLIAAKVVGVTVT